MANYLRLDDGEVRCEDANTPVLKNRGSGGNAWAGRYRTESRSLRRTKEEGMEYAHILMNQTSAVGVGAPSSAVSAESSSKSFSSAKDAIAGACAGGIAKTIVAPIERVKLIMQLNTSSATTTADTARLGLGTTMKSSNGAWEVTKQVYREQGILAFWRGNTPNVIRQAGSSAMNFLLMDWYKVAISPILVLSLKLPSDRDPEKRNKRRALISSFLSGGLAGGSVTTVLYPVEFVRTRLAMDLGRGTVDAPRLYPGGMKDVCISIWKADGWRGLYQGYGIAVAGVVLYRALHLGGYDAVKTEILHRRGHLIEIARTQEDVKRMSPYGLTMGERFLAAQIVSIIAGTACYPIDSIRRRLMMQAGLTKDKRLYVNSLDCFRKVIASEGMRGFYLGIGPNLVRSFGAAILLVTYDIFKIKVVY